MNQRSFIHTEVSATTAARMEDQLNEMEKALIGAMLFASKNPNSGFRHNAGMWFAAQSESRTARQGGDPQTFTKHIIRLMACLAEANVFQAQMKVENKYIAEVQAAIDGAHSLLIELIAGVPA